MKNIQLIFSLVLILFFINSTQAQMLKKIQKAVENRAAIKTEEKVSDKAEEKKLNPMDYKKNKADPSTVPNTYQFNWKYTLEIQTDKGKAMAVDYFLEPNQEYFGFNVGQSTDMFMIMDHKNKLTITCFDKGKEKIASASIMPDYSDIAEKKDDNTKFTYKTLPDKTFLGYNCKGIEASNEKYVMVFYFTTDAKVSFGEIFKSRQGQKMPNAFKEYFKPGDKPLMLYMTMKDLKNNGQTTHMKCIGLERSLYTFTKSEYKFM